jgi:hypothetical protein
MPNSGVKRLMCFCVTRFHHNERNFFTPTNHLNCSVQSTLFSRILPKNLMTEICRMIQEDRSIFWELTVIVGGGDSSHEHMSQFWMVTEMKLFESTNTKAVWMVTKKEKLHNATSVFIFTSIQCMNDKFVIQTKQINSSSSSFLLLLQALNFL